MQLKWLCIRFRGCRWTFRFRTACASLVGEAVDFLALLLGAGQQQLLLAQKVGREVPLHSCRERIAVRFGGLGATEESRELSRVQRRPLGPGRLCSFGPRGWDCLQCLLTVSLLGRGNGHALRSSCWCSNGCIRPVLKHGPRSATCVRVFGWQTRRRNEGEGRRWSA